VTFSNEDLPTPLLANDLLPIDIDDECLDTPAILVDLDIVDANIDAMASFARREGLAMRPHTKTHKSIAMAQRQLLAGASGLSVATTTEAEVMMRSGVKDLLLAYPIAGKRKLDRLAPLLQAGGLTLVSDSSEITENYRQLAERIRRTIPVILEVDSGMDRVGVDPRKVSSLASELARTKGLHFRGIMTHAGHAHDAPDHAGIEEIARNEASIMGKAREELESVGLEVEIVSAGSTVTSSYLRSSDGITEIRPGTYIYNDLRTLGRYACTPDAMAVTALATVVSINNDRITLNSGSKTLTSTKDGKYGYGALVADPEARWLRLSEEHATLKSSGGVMYSVGDRVQIFPIHVCVWSDLQPEIYGHRNGRIVERIRVDAMRHSL
jgi:D-serine deaminase-like pyridoxal phosphate-dependent protein